VFKNKVLGEIVCKCVLFVLLTGVEVVLALLFCGIKGEN
jgi:hypothetical protein